MLETTFIIDFTITTRPGWYPGNTITESFELTVPAASYTEAKEKAFGHLKQAASFEDLMNKINNGAFVPQKGQ